jgi:hypothetical protein
MRDSTSSEQRVNMIVAAANGAPMVIEDPESRASLRHAAVTASRTALAMRSRFGKTWDSSTGV